MPARLPKLAVFAAVVAFLLALGGLASNFGHVLLMLPALVPAIAGATILRRRAWGAYGFALFELTQTTMAAMTLFNASNVPTGQITALIVVGSAITVLFFLAGRSLSAVHARSGLALPWVVVSLLFTVPFFFLHAFMIPTGAMEDTLMLGDRIMVRTFPPLSPARGDIIVFRYPIDRAQTFVKRIVGLPGDRIRIASQIVYRNGSALAEPYAVHKFDMPDKYRDNFPANSADVTAQSSVGQMLAAKEMLQNHVSGGEVVVPLGKYFVLGDNRDNSLDSRYWGFLEASDIIGKPIFIYDSEILQGENEGSQGSLIQRVRWSRIFKLL